MRFIVISTTIKGDAGYLPFDRLLAQSKFTDTMFVVAGDRGAAPFNVNNFKCPVEYLDEDAQKRFNVSETIGWKTPRRRPAAWLRAIELGADFILSVDDDNIPFDDYFDRWHKVLTSPARSAIFSDSGVKNGAVWHNYLKTSDAPIEFFPRGFPIPFRKHAAAKTGVMSEPVPPEKIGLWQGVSLGDPDIDAITRLVYPKPKPLASLADKNYCLKHVWSPYNMQNTVFSKMLFGLPILWPHAGRFDDIYASFAWQKLLFNNDIFVHVGDPVNLQDRGERDTLNGDFREEVEGYFSSHEVWEEINSIEETETGAFLEKLISADHDIIRREREFFAAYLKDMELAGH